MSAPDIRLNDDKSLDEIVAENADFHLEQMDGNVWWLSVVSGGKIVNVWLRARGKISPHYEIDDFSTKASV